MQTATLSAYQLSEFVPSAAKSSSLRNENEPRFDISHDTYEFVDKTKKVSYLTGSARGTLVTATDALTSNSHSVPTVHTNSNMYSLSSAMSKLRFGKSISR
jgi:hypothetical protein